MERPYKILIVDLSDNQKSNQLSRRNHQFFPPTPYSLLPTPSFPERSCEVRLSMSKKLETFNYQLKSKLLVVRAKIQMYLTKDEKQYLKLNPT